MASLLNLITLCNNPDVFMPAYAAHRASALFFGVFIAGGAFFLLPLIMAAECHAYSRARARRRLSSRAAHDSCVRAAFALLDTRREGAIGLPAWRALFAQLAQINMLRTR